MTTPKLLPTETDKLRERIAELEIALDEAQRDSQQYRLWWHNIREDVKRLGDRNTELVARLGALGLGLLPVPDNDRLGAWIALPECEIVTDQPLRISLHRSNGDLIVSTIIGFDGPVAVAAVELRGKAVRT